MNGMTTINQLEEIIESYNEYVKQLGTGTINLANLFRQKNNKDGLMGVTSFSEGMEWLIAINKHFLMNEIVTNFDELKIIGFLEEINEALLVEDYFLVADLFEYEIADYFLNLPAISIEQ